MTKRPKTEVSLVSRSNRTPIYSIISMNQRGKTNHVREIDWEQRKPMHCSPNYIQSSVLCWPVIPFQYSSRGWSHDSQMRCLPHCNKALPTTLRGNWPSVRATCPRNQCVSYSTWCYSNDFNQDTHGTASNANHAALPRINNMKEYGRFQNTEYTLARSP